MIPKQLTLSNFLSYQQATLDFTGLDTACICGVNGAGKSSLLEAITWALWGKTRTTSDEDVINSTAKEAQVDFRFQCNGDTYRVLRGRRRGQSASLELQVQHQNQFQSLTAKGVKATQKKINELLKLDYDTFINSSYLRQGRADEFMLRSPTERKKLLAELLKLDQYQDLSEEAKDVSRKLKGQSEQLEQTLAPTEKELEQKTTIAQSLATIETNYKALQEKQEADQTELQRLQTLDSQRQAKQQQIDWYNQQYQTIAQDYQKLIQEQQKVQQSLSELNQLLAQETEIKQAYQTYLDLQKEQATLAQKFESYQELTQRSQQIKEQQQTQINEFKLQQQRIETELENLIKQEESAQKILQKEDEIKEAVAKLNQARERLKELDQLQQEVSPLMQRRQTLQLEIDREAERKKARLEQIETNLKESKTELAKVPEREKEYHSIIDHLKELEKKETYSQRLQEKRQKQQELQARLQQTEKNHEKQLNDLVKKLELLQNPEASCPLCERPLDEEHKQRVTDKTQREYQTIEAEKATIWEDLANSKRELDQYSQDYEALTQELAEHDKLVARRAQLESYFDEDVCNIHEKISNLNREKREIQEILEQATYSQEKQAELQNIEQRLTQINYDEKTHAIAREKVDNLRYADRKAEQLADAKKEVDKINQRKPELEQSRTKIQEQIAATENSFSKQLQTIDQEIKNLGYARSRHNEVMSQVQEAQKSQLKYQKLEQAKTELPQKQGELTDINQRLQSREQEKADCQQQLDTLNQAIKNVTDGRNEIKQLEQKTQQQRQQLDSYLSEKGKLGQRLNYLEELKTKYQDSKEKLKTLKRKETVYKELSQAFGKNGIQALMIENILPQLEAQTNQILSRLTGNQLHVQFLTQRAGKGRSKKQTKLIDTLDIIIADAQGTRAYETYSGGEGFRINFAIRLALAKLLAQRSGTALQLLIVDEGFGTQDSHGCERLIAAINAIAPDFSCILAVTHMREFKEAFQHRIEVTKTDQGSQITVSS